MTMLGMLVIINSLYKGYSDIKAMLQVMYAKIIGGNY